MNSNAGATKQPCNACYTGSGCQHAESPITLIKRKHGIVTIYSGGGAVAWWLMPRTPDPEVGGSSPTRVKTCCVP